jgi:hypothetical protein
MPHQMDGPRDDVRAHEDTLRRAILGLLMQEGSKWPWSLGELEAEVGEPQAVRDAVRQLQGLRLVHRCEDFVWPTRAALAAESLLG